MTNKRLVKITEARIFPGLMDTSLCLVAKCRYEINCLNREKQKLVQFSFFVVYKGEFKKKKKKRLFCVFLTLDVLEMKVHEG